MTINVYDWDDTLFFTKQTIVEAYVRAGAPRDEVLRNWGKPWYTWTFPYITRKKSEIYKELVRDPEWSPQPTPILEKLADESRIYVITGASANAVHTLLDAKREQNKEDRYPINVLAASMTREGKIKTLRNFSYYMGTDVIYYDDDKETVRAVCLNGDLRGITAVEVVNGTVS